jgi:hypothetical protein
MGSIPGSSPTQYGIRDLYSQTGNSYSNDSFDGGQYTELSVESPGVGAIVPVVLEHSHFEAPSN